MNPTRGRVHVPIILSLAAVIVTVGAICSLYAWGATVLFN